jgi:hypothetical protein
MLFDIKRNNDVSKICECHRCESVATNELMLFSEIGIYMCDKCLDNTISNLSNEFEFNRIES